MNGIPRFSSIVASFVLACILASAPALKAAPVAKGARAAKGARRGAYKGRGHMLQTSQDGTRVMGYLSLPKGAGTHPGIVGATSGVFSSSVIAARSRTPRSRRSRRRRRP